MKTLESIIEQVRNHIPMPPPGPNATETEIKEAFILIVRAVVKEVLAEVVPEENKRERGKDCECIIGESGQMYEGCSCAIFIENACRSELLLRIKEMGL